MKLFIIIFLSLLFVNFFGATSIANTILLGMMLPFVILDITKRSLFKKQILIVIAGLICSIISCYYFREQPMLITFKNSAMFFYILFYFMVRYINPDIFQMEKAIIILTTALCLCYILQYMIYPTVIFSGAEKEYDEDIRIRLTGQTFSSLGYFLGISKYLKTKKLGYAFLSILCFVVIFLMGFRTMLALILIFTVVLIIKVNGFNWRFFLYSFFGVVLLFVLLQVPAIAGKVDSMLDRQQTQNFGNQNYIRVIQFQYFTQEHFKSFIEFIFGSGYPSRGTEITSYGIQMQGLLDMGITWMDFGLLSISWIIGIPTVLAMIAYAIKAYRLKIPKDYYYLGIWFGYLVTVSFTTADFIRPGCFIVQSLALFLVEKISRIYKQKLTNRI